MKNVSHSLSFGKSFLKEHNIDSYSIDARVLLMEATGLSLEEMLISPNLLLTDNSIIKYNELLKKRSLNMPVAYILNRSEFMSLPFYVDENVLIPRPDTEILVEKAIETINSNSFSRVLEIGVGSGCISVSLANYCKNIEIVACDISKEALSIASKNAVDNRVSDKIDFVASDIFKNVKGSFDLIISNPPYIDDYEFDNLLLQNVKNYEPHLALKGGQDGLYFYKKIVTNSKPFLNENGYLMFEIGCNQAKQVSCLFEENNFSNISVLDDLAGLNRVVFAKKMFTI